MVVAARAVTDLCPVAFSPPIEKEDDAEEFTFLSPAVADAMTTPVVAAMWISRACPPVDPSITVLIALIGLSLAPGVHVARTSWFAAPRYRSRTALAVDVSWIAFAAGACFAPSPDPRYPRPTVVTAVDTASRFWLAIYPSITPLTATPNTSRETLAKAPRMNSFIADG
jgi:hypothetical protein